MYYFPAEEGLLYDGGRPLDYVQSDDAIRMSPRERHVFGKPWREEGFSRKHTFHMLTSDVRYTEFTASSDYSRVRLLYSKLAFTRRSDETWSNYIAI